MKLKKIAASMLAATAALSAFAFCASAEEVKESKLSLLTSDIKAELKSNIVYIEGYGLIDITGKSIDSSENSNADDDANLDVDFDEIGYISAADLKTWQETGELKLTTLKADFDTTGLKWGMFNDENGYVQLVKMEKQKAEGSDEETNVVTERGLYKIENGEIKKCCDLDTFWTTSKSNGVSVGCVQEYATVHYTVIDKDEVTGEVKTTESDEKYLVGMKLVITQPDGKKKETTIAKAPLNDMTVTIDRTDENFNEEESLKQQFDGLYYFSDIYYNLTAMSDCITSSLVLQNNFGSMINDNLSLVIYTADFDGNVKKVYETNYGQTVAKHLSALNIGDNFYWYEADEHNQGMWSRFCLYNTETEEVTSFDYEYDGFSLFDPYYMTDSGVIMGEVYTIYKADNSHTNLGYAIFDNIEDFANWESKTYYKDIHRYTFDEGDTKLLLKFEDADGKKGYMDESGKVLAYFDVAGGFMAELYAPVVKDGKAFLIDKEMNEVSTEIEAEDVFAIDEDLFVAMSGDKTYLVTYATESEPSEGETTNPGTGFGGAAMAVVALAGAAVVVSRKKTR